MIQKNNKLNNFSISFLQQSQLTIAKNISLNSENDHNYFLEQLNIKHSKSLIEFLEKKSEECEIKFDQIHYEPSNFSHFCYYEFIELAKKDSKYKIIFSVFNILKTLREYGESYLTKDNNDVSGHRTDIIIRVRYSSETYSCEGDEKIYDFMVNSDYLNLYNNKVIFDVNDLENHFFKEIIDNIYDNNNVKITDKSAISSIELLYF